MTVQSLSKYLKMTASLIFVQFFLFKKIYSQNLISNSSFEYYTNPIDCSAGGFDNYYYSPAPHVLDNWYGYQSPDYFNSVCTVGWYNVPHTVFGDSYAKLNNAYVGISVFQANNLEYKEYIYQQLQSPLLFGQTYCLSFFVSKADRKEYAIKNIGALLCNSLPAMVNNMYINAIPQVVNTNSFITDTTQWTQIQGCFMANGGEQYIVIGNFNSNINTDTLYTGTNNPIPNDPPYAYYFIDDITLYNQATVGSRESGKENGIEIHPNPANSILNIFDKQNQFKNSIIEITDYLGQTVYVNSFSNYIDISLFESGLYFLTLNDNLSEIKVKFIKQ